MMGPPASATGFPVAGCCVHVLAMRAARHCATCETVTACCFLDMECILRVGAMRSSAHMSVLGRVRAIGQPPCPMGALIDKNGPERLGGLCLGTEKVHSCVTFGRTGMFPTYPSGLTRVKLAIMGQKQVVAIGFRVRWAIYDHVMHGVWPQLYGSSPDQHFLILDCTRGARC